MNEWDDQDIDQSDDYAPSPPKVRSGSESLFTWPLIAAAALALIAGLTLFWLFSSRGPVTVPELADERPAPVIASPSATEPEEAEPEEPDVVLPELSESDAFVREALGKLSRHPGLASFLLTDELARKIVAAVANIAEGENPARHFPYLAPDEKFSVVSRAPQVFLDPRSYHRYNTLASAFASVDSQALVALYEDAKPLLDEAYAELGYPGEEFERALQKAVTILLQTPVVDGRVELTLDSVNYAFAAPHLEALAPAQKQLVRTGPENTKKVQGKLRELAAALGIPTDS